MARIWNLNLEFLNKYLESEENNSRAISWDSCSKSGVRPILVGLSLKIFRLHFLQFKSVMQKSYVALWSVHS